MKKRIASIFIVLAMLCTSIPFSAVSAVAETSGDYEYTILEDGTAEITNYTGSDTEIVIPSELDGHKVTKIGRGAFYFCDSLTSIKIPDGITSIGGSAFMGCKSLTSIVIGSDVKSIGRDVFYNCVSLMSITIPDSVEKIEDFLFHGCASLSKVTIGSGATFIGDYAFSGCLSLTCIEVSDQNENYSSIDGVLFNKDKTKLILYPRCKNETNYIIPDSVTIIEDGAFYNCTALESVSIPEGVTAIGFYAFEYCTSLTSITIPNNVTEIESGVFSGCTALTSVAMGNDVTSIGSSAFYGCSALKEISIPEGVTAIGFYTFEDCKSLTNVTIPNSVEVIYDGAFLDCNSLVSISIGDGLVDLGDGDEDVFGSCDSLKSIEISENNKKYSSVDGVLFDKNQTTLIKYPDGKIESSYVIPDTVTSIDFFAFDSCNNLKRVEIPDSVTTIIGKAFLYCKALENIEVSEQNDNFSSIDGVLFNKDKTILIVYPKCRTDISYIIPDGVKAIGKSAFYECKTLSSLTMPNSITNIYYFGFYGCTALKNITLSNSLTSIGDFAFENCISLTNIEIPDSVTHIANETFSMCDSLTSIDVSENNENYSSINGVLFSKDKTKLIQYPIGKSDNSYIVMDGVCYIEEYAFDGCTNLMYIEIPNSIKEIRHYTFFSCSTLTDIYYTGSEEQWNLIIPSYNDTLLSTTIHFNSYMPVDTAFEIKESSGLSLFIDSIVNKKVLTGISVGTSQSEILSKFENSENIQIVDKNGNLLLEDANIGTGTVLQLLENGVVVDELVIAIAGELDGDGTIDSKDVVVLKRYITEGWDTDVIKTAAKINNDGIVNAKDVLLLRRYIIGGWDVNI